MIKTRSQNIRLGIFITISIAVLSILVGYFTTRQFFEKTDTYYVVYHDISVSGLEIGSPVKYMGIKVGTITNITIDPTDVKDIIVELALKPYTPIKQDAQADIISVGITGLKTIEIRAGSNESEFLEVGGYIIAGGSVAEEITGKAEIIAQKAERVLNNLQIFTEPENLDKITGLVDQLSILTEKTTATVQGADSLINENRYMINASVENVVVASENLRKTSEMVNSTIVRLNQLIKSDTITDILASTRKVTSDLSNSDIKKMIDNISNVARETDVLLNKINRDFDLNSDELTKNLLLLRVTLENLNDASRKINQDPSILIRGVKDKRILDNELDQND